MDDSSAHAQLFAEHRHLSENETGLLPLPPYRSVAALDRPRSDGLTVPAGARAGRQLGNAQLQVAGRRRLRGDFNTNFP